MPFFWYNAKETGTGTGGHQLKLPIKPAQGKVTDTVTREHMLGLAKQVLQNTPLHNLKLLRYKIITFIEAGFQY